MDESPAPWIAALRSSHDRLATLVEPLDDAQLENNSYCSNWTIAQVLSHLGSGAEIFGQFLDSGLSGTEPPGQEAFVPIWDSWNAKTPRAQAEDALATDEDLVERFESLSPEDQDRFRIEIFGMDADTTFVARMRLSEHSVHTWDVDVVLNPKATVADSAVELLIDTIGAFASRTGKPDGKERHIHITTSDPKRNLVLETGETVTLTSSDHEGGSPSLVLPAESLIRLVYGRLDPEHTPPVEADGVDLGELRHIFPGV